MPVHVHSIGTSIFFDLVGIVCPKQEQLEIIERPGVIGTGARRTGVRGKPFDLVSITYHGAFSDAGAALDEYTDYVGANPVTLTRNGVALMNVLVIAVTEAKPPQAVFNVAGSPGSECRAEVRWTLVGM